MSSSESKRLIIHIGVPKGGSTAIQCALLTEQNKLSSRGIIYPNLTGEGFGWQAERGLSGGNAWSYAFDPSAPNFDFKSNDQAKLAFAGLVNACHEYTGKFNTIILSNELLQRIAHEKYFWDQLDEFRTKSKFEVSVVLYLRDPMNMVRAFYSERIKRGQTLKSFEDYVRDTEDVLPPIYMQLEEFLSNALQVKMQPIILRYEAANSKIERHFFDLVLGPAVKDVELPSLKTNPSLSILELEFLRGVHTVSNELGMILCWELTDMQLNRLKVNYRYMDKRLYLSDKGQSLLESKFSILKARFTGLLEFAGDIDYAIGDGKVSNQVDDVSMEARANIYELGKFVGRSFDTGYLNWEIRNKINKITKLI